MRGGIAATPFGGGAVRDGGLAFMAHASTSQANDVKTSLLCAVVAVLGIASALTGCSTAHGGSPSAHFDGKRFYNPGHNKESSVAGYLWLRLTTSQAPWPSEAPVPPMPQPPARVSDGSARVTLVGHATVLIQVAGMNILTDPVWSERASPFSFSGPKRVTPPGVAWDALPTIDLVLISHDHFDHLDLPTLRRLDARDRPRVIAPLGHSELLMQAMPDSIVSEHDWGESVTLGAPGSEGVDAITVHVEPMLHGSGRSPFDQQQRLWASFVIDAGDFKLLHIGDSGYGDGSLFREIGAKYGGFDLAIIPIGAYEPESFMKDSHMNPADAVKLMKDVRASQAMAHHFEVYQLGFEAHDAPRNALTLALNAAGVPESDFYAPVSGEGFTFSR